MSEERTVKLARSMMRTYAARLHKEQCGVCAICKLPLDMTIKGEGVLDHDHDTGRIRGVVHRSCNAAEGKVANAAGQWGAKSTRYSDIIAFVKKLLDYWNGPQKKFIYPYHKTEDEKRQIRNVRSRKNRASARAKRILAAREAGSKDTDD